MKKMSILGTVLLLIMALYAAPPASVEANDVKTFTGKVQMVDSEEKSVVVGGPEGDMVLYMEKHSRITKEGAPKSLADLQAGAIVQVTYTVVSDDNIVKTIAIMP